MKTSVGRKTLTAGATLAATVGLMTATAPSAQAAGSYNIRIDTLTTNYVADYCLLTTTSGNAQAACSGNKGKHDSFRLGTVHNTNDRVWLDINIVAGTDRKGIDLQGKHYIRTSGDLFAVEVCGWKSLESYTSGNTGVPLHGDTLCWW
ncbi:MULTISPECIES: hypothetical protein [unclassified Streptomyces]|uniref:hypothetical protein n=1 Tax=unclassified Streptomyces TaxID=2593676 RepID=UPI002E7A3F1D|nr:MULTISPECIES: hypothetical protein [unclassified Streptomyces]MEE1763916.1 hypothetical protein [Streptomyces sp. SP18BB07]MEE1829470.1 hypothetical protein [Streptomyces sp. SP17KL33]